MTQLAKSLGFNLADTLTGDIEFLADILKRAGFAVVKPGNAGERLSPPAG